MFYIAILLMLLYYFLFLIYYRKLFPVQGSRWIRALLSLAMVAAVYLLLKGRDLAGLSIPVLMLSMIAGLRFSTGMNWLQAMYAGNFCILGAYCFRGIFTATISLIIPGYDFLNDANAYYTVTLFALPCAVLFFAVLRKIFLTDDKIKRFLRDHGQLKIVITYELATMIHLIILNSGRFLSPDGRWYIKIALGTCSLTLGMLIYAIYQSIRGVELLEYQWKTQMLEEQYDIQLRHYKSYQKYTESFRAFKHDFKSVMATLKSLLRTNENKKAIELLDNMYDDLQKKVKLHKRYSDNIVLEAMLQDLANICEEQEIRFSSNVFAPQKTGLSLLDAIRIFSNITQNAVEACGKVSPSERFIDIISRNDQPWVTLQIVNSYNGEVLVENGKFLTTKTEDQSHGLGLGIVREIVEDLGGFMICEAENKTFLLKIHIPQLNDEDRPDGP